VKGHWRPAPACRTGKRRHRAEQQLCGHHHEQQLQQPAIPDRAERFFLERDGAEPGIFLLGQRERKRGDERAGQWAERDVHL